ncbi:AAA family ATPase [Actinocorallia libanotica]|uniref:AAA domain-containing protein n=1 Tax=Actinocorallia libanotica TaxID=46162 RepID=A0ABP4BZS6_9ACTN
MADATVVLICGPAGVGKSSTAYEVSRQLARSDIAHALIETDELDRVHPWPPPGLDTAELSKHNLHALWSNYQALGHTRLILTGVFVDLTEPLDWIRHVLPRAGITLIRLTADTPTLRTRILQRELGPEAEKQWRRTLTQLHSLNATAELETLRIDTTGRTPTDIATEIIEHWRAFWNL